MENKNEKNKGFEKEAWEWFKSILIALILVFIIKWLIFDIVAIDGISMQPTLHNNDRVFVNIISFKFTKYKKGEVIIFTPVIEKGSYFVKRIIATEGDTLSVKGGKVYVNGSLLNEPYLASGTYTEGNFTLKVPAGHVFVMGDNRMNSEDSRDPRLGPVPVSSILGRAEWRVYPFYQMNKL